MKTSASTTKFSLARASTADKTAEWQPHYWFQACRKACSTPPSSFNGQKAIKLKQSLQRTSRTSSKPKAPKYLRVKMMSLLDDLVEKGKRKIAIVGTPCEVRAARKIQQALLDEYPDLQLTIIGLFCFEAFDYDKLKDATKRLMGIDLDSVDKTQINKGKFIATVKGNDYSVAVKDLGAAQEHGCTLLRRFTNKYADISVGSVGSPDGFSTVIVRSDVGAKLLENLQVTKGEVNKDEVTSCLYSRRTVRERISPRLCSQKWQVQASAALQLIRFSLTFLFLFFKKAIPSAVSLCGFLFCFK